MKNKWLFILSICSLLLTSTAYAQTYLWINRESADCDGLTDGTDRHLCHDTTLNTLWDCEPSAGACDTAGEWKQLSVPVTFAGTGTYITLSGQQITVDPITESDISDLTHTATSDSTWTNHNNYPAACSASNWATTIGDTLTCTQPAFTDISGSVTDGQVPDNITITLSATATALAADPGNCASSGLAGGITANGTAEGCITPNAGTDITADLEEETHASEHAVGGGDTAFPADPNADKYLMWDDAPTGELVWSDSTAETNNLETVATGIADTEIFIGNGASSGTYVSVSGDGSLANTGALTVNDDSHNHVITNIDSFTEANLETQLSDVTALFTNNVTGDVTVSGGTSAITADSIVDADLAITESIYLPPQSAKISGAFVVFTPGGGDATTQGAAIDAGDGNWRLLFDATTDEGAMWQFRLPDYWSAHSEVNVFYTMASATANEVEFEVAVMCISDGDSADIGTASFANVAVGSVTVPGTAGYPDEVSITVTDDSCAAGDMIFLFLSTDSNDAVNDDATGDREVVGVEYEFTR